DYFTWPYIVNPKFHNTLAEVNLPADAREATCDLAVDPGQTVTGTAVDPDGKPLGGVRVTGAWGSALGRVVTGADGRFTIPAADPQRPQPYFFQPPQRKLGTYVLFKGDQLKDVTVKLQPCGVVKGRLLDLDEQVLAGRRMTGYFEDDQLNVKVGWAGLF